MSKQESRWKFGRSASETSVRERHKLVCEREERENVEREGRVCECERTT